MSAHNTGAISITEKEQVKSHTKQGWEAYPSIVGLWSRQPGFRNYYMHGHAVQPHDIDEPLLIIAVDNSGGVISGSSTAEYLPTISFGAETEGVILVNAVGGHVGHTWTGVATWPRAFTPESLTERDADEATYWMLRKLYWRAIEDDSEDRMEGNFLVSLQKIIIRYGDDAIQAISRLRKEQAVRPKVRLRALAAQYLVGEIEAADIAAEMGPQWDSHRVLTFLDRSGIGRPAERSRLSRHERERIVNRLAQQLKDNLAGDSDNPEHRALASMRIEGIYIDSEDQLDE